MSEPTRIGDLLKARPIIPTTGTPTPNPEFKKEAARKEEKEEQKIGIKPQKVGAIRIDKEKFKQFPKIFRAKAGPSPEGIPGVDEKGREIVTYNTTTKDGILTRKYLKDKIAEMGGTPTLGRSNLRVFLSLQWLCQEQNNGLEVNFNATEMAKLWGIDNPAGRFYEDFRKAFYSLALVNQAYSNNKEGKDREEWGYSFIADWRIKGDGRETRYYCTLNSEALGIAAKLLNSNMSVDYIREIGGYISYSTDFLKERSMPETEQNFRDKLEGFKSGNSYPVNLFTIASEEWCGFNSDKLRRPKDCLKVIKEYLDNAKKRGQLTDYKIYGTDDSGWTKTWRKKGTPVKIVIEKSGGKRSPVGIEPAKLTDSGRTLLNEIVNWLKLPFNNIRMSREDVQKQVFWSMIKYGEEKIKQLYKDSSGTKPDTKAFWDKIKELKAKRLANKHN